MHCDAVSAAECELHRLGMLWIVEVRAVTDDFERRAVMVTYSSLGTLCSTRLALACEEGVWSTVRDAVNIRMNLNQ